MGSSRRDLQQAKERVASNIQWMEANVPVLEKFLSNYNYGSWSVLGCYCDVTLECLYCDHWYMLCFIVIVLQWNPLLWALISAVVLLWCYYSGIPLLWPLIYVVFYCDCITVKPHIMAPDLCCGVIVLILQWNPPIMATLIVQDKWN